ncbi:MAG: NAD(+) diphosphatase [Alphaproteobacteria bacterium]
MGRPNYYGGGWLDRAAERRNDGEWVRSRLRDSGARLVPVWRHRSFVVWTEGIQAVTLAAEHLPHVAPETHEPPLLGVDGETAYFALDLSHIDDPGANRILGALGRFEDLRTVGPLLSHREGALLAYARALVYWHNRHRFCGICGAPTESASAGHSRRCSSPSCAAEHFPRTDPAVIVLVHDGDRVVLGRSPRFPQGMHSVLAGFVEPGESLEDAVRREVLEEVGIALADVSYHSSQPWPFPSSLMIGFTARAAGFDIRLDARELEAAGWFGRDEIANSPENESFRLPRRDSIARRLIEDWLSARPG